MATHSRILAWWEFHGQRSQVGCSPWSCKESDMTEQLTLSLFFISLSISQYINRKDGECFLIWQVSYMAVIYENSHCTSEYSYKHPLFACPRTVFLSLCAMEPRWFCWGHSGVIIKSWQQVWVSPAFFSIGAALLSILHIWLLQLIPFLKKRLGERLYF